MECLDGHARSTWVVSREGAAAKVHCTASSSLSFPEQLPITTDPQEGLLGIYIAGGTLRHQPIGEGHVIPTFLVHPI